MCDEIIVLTGTQKSFKVVAFHRQAQYILSLVEYKRNVITPAHNNLLITSTVVVKLIKMLVTTNG